MTKLLFFFCRKHRFVKFYLKKSPRLQAQLCEAIKIQLLAMALLDRLGVNMSGKRVSSGSLVTTDTAPLP